MPPRYAYWTILIDNTPTAFRAREQEELLPTLAQLRRTNANVVMKWFARGRIWDSPEAEREAQRKPPAGGEKRGRDWRPGGAHRDSRDRVRKKEGERQKFGPPRDSRPWPDKPGVAGKPDGPPRQRPWPNTSNRPPFGPPRGDRPWQNKGNRPPSGPPRGDRPWQNKSGRPPSGPPHSDKPWIKSKTDKPSSGAPHRGRSWDRKPGQPYGKPQGHAKPWRDKPDKPGGPPRGDRPWHNKPRTGRPFVPRDQRPPRKRRDDDPDDK